MMEENPIDWPGSGPIDLTVHDLPHASSTTEWWYQNGHLTSEDGRNFAFFAAFFRQVKGKDPVTKAPDYGHSVTWAVVDLDREHYAHYSGVDQSAPTEGLKRIARGLGSKDVRLNRALAEILERGNVPQPDRVFKDRVFVSTERLDLNYSGDGWKKLDSGRYQLKLFNERLRAGVELEFEPMKPATRHGTDGVVRGSADERMFYYFIPRNRVTGTVTHNGVKMKVAEGSGWYDHEFGVGHNDDVDDVAEAKMEPEARKKVQAARRLRKETEAVGWNWLSGQLDDGSELSVYPEEYIHSKQSAGHYSITIAADGTRSSWEDMTLEPLEWWQSMQTFFDYPIKWKLSIPSAGIDIEATAAFADQEFITLISKPSFWEGRVNLKGTIKGKPITGRGFVERSGFTPFEDLDGYFEAVGKVVRRSVANVLPLEPTYEQARDLIASKEREQYMDGLDIAQYARTHIKPIREITDRGGKGWRSYAAVTCCDIVGGDSRDFVQWLALPEMMHVGSLIVDDVQDKSEVRRGGKTAHLIYGEAQAINSGTAGYFICHKLLTTEKVSDADRLRLYDLYFESLRAGHAGQAIDLDGFEAIMPDIVERGAGEELERRVCAVHRLKTAAPAGCLARMGAIGGGGTEAQIDGLGRFFEAVGLAFQIVDDVLNLRGFKGDLKAKAEDVAHGKITLPVSKAMSRLPVEKRRWLYHTLKSKPQDQAVIQQVVDLLEECGAVDASAKHARDIVEDAWLKLEPLVEDTLAKLMLRAFSWYVLERHY